MGGGGGGGQEVARMYEGPPRERTLGIVKLR